MIACVYLIRCKVNGMVYIGKTKNFPERMRNHLTVAKMQSRNNQLYKDIAEHKWENFEYEILYHMYDVLDDKLLDEIERKFIAEYRELGICYNLDSGGTIGYKASLITLQRMSQGIQRGGSITYRKRYKNKSPGIRYYYSEKGTEKSKSYSIREHGLVKALGKCILMKIRFCKKHNIPFNLNNKNN